MDAAVEPFLTRDFGPEGPSVDDFRSVMERLPTLQRQLAFANLAAQLRPQTARELYTYLVESDASSRYEFGREKAMFWERWGEIDGPAAAAQIFHNDRRFEETETSKSVIKAWAKFDPKSAHDWIMRQEDVPLRTGMLRGVLEGYAETKPEAAYDFIRKELQDTSLRAHGYWRIASAYQAQSGMDGVLDFYSKFDRKDPDFLNFSRTVADLYSEYPVERGLEWVTTLDSELQGKVAPQFLRKQLERNPDGLVECLSKTATPPAVDRAPLITSAVRRWVAANPNAMGTWLQRNRDAPHFDEVAAPFVRTIRTTDPAAAAAWAETIRDPEIKNAVISELDH